METSVPPPKSHQKTTAASLRTPCGIGDLPPEVLLYIFQFFNVNELDSTISPVCRLWRDLSQRSCVRLELALQRSGPDTSAAGESLRSCPNLRDLCIAGRLDADDLLHHVALYNHDLRRLAVRWCKGSPNKRHLSEQILDEILLCCPHIVDLTIINSQLQSNKLFRDLGFRLPELRRININSFLGSNELKMIVASCIKLEEIRSLRLERLFPLPRDKSILFVEERLRGTLKVLEIDGQHMKDEGIALLGRCCQLRKLYIRNGFRITDNGVSHLSRLRNLVVLDLRTLRKVSSCGWVKLFSESDWRNMKNLALAHCPTVDDNTLQQVATVCPNLVTLEVSYCYLFTHKGLRSVLQTCTNLEDLDIRKTQDNVFRSFSNIPLHTCKLKRLVYNTHGQEREKRVFMYLKETIPECDIIRL